MNNLTFSDRTDSSTPTGATTEVNASIINAIKNFINEPAQSGTTFDDSGSITVDGTKVYSTTRSVTASTHSLTIAASGHKSNNYIHARYSFSQACTITLNNFDSTLNSTGTINPIPAGTYDFFFTCVNSALGVSLIIPNNVESTQSQLGTPSNFSGIAGDSQITFTWDNVVNATGYVLEFHNGDNNWAGVPGYDGTSTTYLHSSLTNGTTYYYRLKATASGYIDSSYSQISRTPAVALTNTHSMIVDETAEGMEFNDPNMYFSDGANNDSPWTVCIWFKTPSAIIASGALFITDDDAGSFHQSILLNSDFLSVRSYDGGTTNRIGVDATNNVLTTDTWYKVAVSYDGSGAYTGFKLYVNEVLCTVSQQDNGTYVGLDALSGNMHVRFPGSGAAYGAGTYNCFRTFDKVLSLSEIQLLSSGMAPITIPTSLQTNLVCEYLFNNNLNAETGVNGSAIGSPTYTTEQPS